MGVMNISDLQGKLRSDIHSAVLGEVRAYCEKVLRKHIMQSVYAGGSSQYYARTYQFVNAVDVMDVKANGSYVSFRVGINPAHIGQASSISGRLNTHMGVSGQDMRGGIAEVLNEGIGSKIVPNRKAAKFFESAHSEMDANIANMLVGALRARGWDAYIM